MHPILFDIHGFFVGSYGVMIVLGLGSALWVAMRLAKFVKLPGEFFYDLAFVCLVAGFVGARIFFIGLNWREFLDRPVAMMLSRSGFVFQGGFLGAVPAAYWFIRRKKMPIWTVGDIAAPCLVLAHAFGRIGCFLAGCCYGRVCAEGSGFCVRFPRVLDAKGEDLFSFAYMDHLHRGLVAPEAMASAPVIPTQLIESATNFLICGALLLLWRRRKFQGEIFACYLLLYGATRFMLEYLRGDAERGLWLGGALSTSQIICLATIMAGAIVWAVLRTQEPTPTKPAAKAGAAPGK